MVDPLLGGHSPARFLRRFWQKEALLVRGAIPGFHGPLDPRALLALACRDDVESRLIVRDGRRWTLEHGPFRVRRLRALPARGWTVLVQGVNLVDAEADALLRQFSFVPYARLDDLMVSIAAPGGGVGPHFDSYDVFLLQGLGRRRWRISSQADLELVPGLPVKILRRFRAERQWTLGPGDLLYLPPRFAHDGVALDFCTTWSIGFRAPQAQELAVALLAFVQDEIALDGIYEDPDLRPTAEPARIDPALDARIARMLAPVRWDRSLLERFVGCFLSEPKPHVFFDRPPRPLPQARFAQGLARRGLRLDLRSQMLYDDRWVFMNGDAVAWPGSGGDSLRTLADRRVLPPLPNPAPELLGLFHGWYRNGFAHLAR